MSAIRVIEGLVLLLLRLALGGVFVWAAWVKLDDPQAFADTIKGFKLLPAAGDHLVVLASFAVPWVEMLAGAVLMLGLWTRAAALVLLINLLSFIAAIVSVLQRGISTKCGCFGELSPFCPEEISGCNIVQNSILGAMALVLLIRGRGLLGLDRRPKASRTTKVPAPAATPAGPILTAVSPAKASPSPAPAKAPPKGPPSPRRPG